MTPTKYITIITPTDGQVKRMFDLLQEIINCPHSIDEATVPKSARKTGNYSHPQIVANYSISYSRILAAKKLIAEIKATDL